MVAERKRTLQTQGRQRHGGERQQDVWCVTGGWQEVRGSPRLHAGKKIEIKHGCLMKVSSWFVLSCHSEGYGLEPLDYGVFGGQISKLKSQHKVRI